MGIRLCVKVCVGMGQDVGKSITLGESRANSWWVSDEAYQRNLADMQKEMDAVVRARELIAELIEVVDPIKNWGGDEPGDSIVYKLVDGLRVAYGGWSPEPAYRKARIPESIKTSVYERDQRTCVACGATENLSLDHVYPERLGGPTTVANLRVLCRSCNSRKGVSVEWES